jgi:acyl-CoA reductase-like NAD-dependent aldehyde dehydrogenase
MQIYLEGQWQDRAKRFEVRNPFSGEVIDTVPQCTAEDVDRAVASAVAGAKAMRRLSGHDRYLILHKLAAALETHHERLARLLSSEEGKTLAEARNEVTRSVQTMECSAEEAKRLGGEVVPLDGAPGGQGKLGFTLRVPCGVVAAISPFNFPLNLVCHKVGPALAAGNAVILKPASVTPLIAGQLVELLLEAGLPPLGIQLITGPGGPIGKAICGDNRVRKITFTGSRDVGEAICRAAGLKRVTMELGSNSPVIVLPDADLDLVARTVAFTGYANAGQVCISAQRIVGVGAVYDDLVSALAERVGKLKAGNPEDESSDIGPLIKPDEAERVGQWIDEAVAQGARVVVGHERDRGVYKPTLLADVTSTMRVSREEIFGPAVGVHRVDSLEAALHLADDTNYGLSASIFTRDLNAALRFAQEVESGNIHINGGPAYRADLMPYGGLKESGFGKEGPKYAIDAMTEMKMVVIHGLG